MFIGKFSHFTSTGSTLHESFFYQERFVNFLNGSRIFSQSRSNGSDTYRATFKLVYNSAKYLVVYLIQTVFIDIQCFQCKLGNLRIDRAGALSPAQSHVPDGARHWQYEAFRGYGKQSPMPRVPNKAHPVWMQNDG